MERLLGKRKTPYEKVPTINNEKLGWLPEDDEDFLPIEDRDEKPPQEGTSPTWKAVANLLSDMEGTGILGLPFAILKGGWVAIGALLIVPFISCYTGRILIDCLYDKQKDGTRIRVRKNYKDIAGAIWPKFGMIVVVATQLLGLCLIASLYLVLAGDLIGAALPNIMISKRQWMVIAAFAGLPSTFFKTLVQVAWLSLISVIALMIAIAMVIGYGIYDRSAWVLSYNELFPPLQFEGVIIALAIIIFSYAAHVAMPSLEASLKDSSQYNKMLYIGYSFTFCIKITFAVITFISFRANIKEVINTSIPMSNVFIAITSLLCINVMFSYPFRILALVRTLEDSVIPESIRSAVPDLLWYILIRVTLNFITLLPAVTIPHFALMMSFLGSLAGSLNAFVYPCVFHLCLKYHELPVWQKSLNILLVVFGFSACGIGLAATGKRLLEAYGLNL